MIKGYRVQYNSWAQSLISFFRHTLISVITQNKTSKPLPILKPELSLIWKWNEIWAFAIGSVAIKMCIEEMKWIECEYSNAWQFHYLTLLKSKANQIQCSMHIFPRCCAKQICFIAWLISTFKFARLENVRVWIENYRNRYRTGNLMRLFNVCGFYGALPLDHGRKLQSNFIHYSVSSWSRRYIASTKVNLIFTWTRFPLSVSHKLNSHVSVHLLLLLASWSYHNLHYWTKHKAFWVQHLLRLICWMQNSHHIINLYLTICNRSWFYRDIFEID